MTAVRSPPPSTGEVLEIIIRCRVRDCTMAIVNNRSLRQPNKKYKPSILTIQTSLNSRFVENESCECQVRSHFLKAI